MADQISEVQTQEQEARAVPPGEWFTCEVHGVGPAENGDIYIRLMFTTQSDLSGRWYTAEATMKREMLATALTATALGRRVAVRLAGRDEFSQIQRFYIANWA